MSRSPTFEKIYAAVRRIPRGRVATYGQIARLAGMPRQPRLVGYALNALPTGSDVPWHRVLNARGTVSRRADSLYEEVQRRLLEEEGVEFADNSRISLKLYLWKPRAGRRSRTPSQH